MRLPDRPALRPGERSPTHNSSASTSLLWEHVRSFPPLALPPFPLLLLLLLAFWKVEARNFISEKCFEDLTPHSGKAGLPAAQSESAVDPSRKQPNGHNARVVRPAARERGERGERERGLPRVRRGRGGGRRAGTTNIAYLVIFVIDM